MKQIETTLFQQFARGSKNANLASTNDCVIYVRVSSKKQTEGYSPEVQLDGCLNYAQRNKLNVVEIFGRGEGKNWESAKTDERKEFQRMLSFIRTNKKVRISYILVYHIDRFSRTGINAAYIAEQLREEKNVKLVPVMSPIDSSTSAGRLQQNIQFLFSHFDNEQRREKSVGGMKRKLERGDWMGTPPCGYDLTTIDRKQSWKINAQGKLIKQAFEWKAQGVTNTEICNRLSARGWKIYRQQLHNFFRNPFYCGIIVNKMLDGQIVQGNHPPLISKELFLQVNDIGTPRNSKHKKEFSETPLKHFVKCSKCGRPFSGYLRKKEMKTRTLFLYYYKCSKPGCKCNRRADKFHEMFSNIVKDYTLPKELLEPMVYTLENFFYEKNKDNIEANLNIKNQLSEIEKNLELTEEKYAFNKISEDAYNRIMGKLNEEKKICIQKLRETDFEFSNLSEYIESAINISSQLSDIWEVKNYEYQKQIQYLLFPDGIFYDREKDCFRTNRVNSILDAICSLSKELKGTKKGQTYIDVNLSNEVATAGIEPASRV